MPAVESRRAELERTVIITSRPFEAVVAALEAEIAHPDFAEIRTIAEGKGSRAELEEAIGRALGSAGLMLFMQFDLGAVVRKQTGQDRPRIVRLLVGNPLIMAEMAKHTPEAGAYAPVTILVDERPGGVHLSYDRMASLLAPYGNADSLAVAQALDGKVDALLRAAAGI